MSMAGSMAKAMHQFMVKASAGVFRARFVVPPYDWPAILEDDETVYDSVSTTIDDNAGRTRLGDGVLVTELAGPRIRNRMLCVTAGTASVFVDVLHRLLCGFAGNSELVSTRLLVNQEDFESAATGGGRDGGVEAAMEELRRTASVTIDNGFEEFHAYPLNGETSMHIVGRPSAVVHCVCLINELLCGMTTAETARLFAADQRLRQPVEFGDFANRRPDTVDGYNFFRSASEHYTEPISTGPVGYGAGGFRSTPESRPTSPLLGLCDLITGTHHSPQTSPTQAWTDREKVDTRPTSPSTRSVSRQLVNQNQSLRIFAAEAAAIATANAAAAATFAIQRPTTRSRRYPGPRAMNRRLSPSCRATKDATTTTTTLTPGTTPHRAQAIANRLMPRNRAIYRAAAAVAATRPSDNSWSARERLANRYASSRLTAATTTDVTTRPATSYQSVSDRLVKRNPSENLADANTTTVTSARSVSDRLVKRNPSENLADANTTTVTSARSVSDRLVNRNPSSHVPPVRSVSDRLNVNRRGSPSCVTTDATPITSTTDQNRPPVRSLSDRLLVNRKQSPPSVTTNVTDTIATNTIATAATPVRSISDHQIVNRRESSSWVTTNATATGQNVTPYLSGSGFMDIDRQLSSSSRALTELNAAINRRTTSVSDRLVNRNPSSRVPPNDTTANTSITSTTDTTTTTSTTTSTITDQFSDINIGNEYGDSLQSDCA